MDKITKNTYFPLFLVIAIVGSVITMTTAWNKLDNRLCRVEEKIDKVIILLDLDRKIVLERF